MPMELTRRSARRFMEEMPAAPQNAGLFPDSALFEILSNPAYDTKANRRTALAELFVRMFLAPERYRAWKANQWPDVARLVHDWLGADWSVGFLARATQCGECGRPSHRAASILENMLREKDEADADAVRTAFLPWLEAEGVIPVFNSQGAYLLPFTFCEVAKSTEEVKVVDWKGREIPLWTGYLRELSPDAHIDRDVQIAFCLNDEVKCNGDSLMLPLLMAWWRRNDRLPRYNPVRFIATGAFHGGRLGAVKDEEKSAKISRDVADGFLVRPGNGFDPGTIPTDSRRDAVMEGIRALAEGRYPASAAYAAKRLLALDGQARGHHTGRGSWRSMTERLETLRNSLDPVLDERDYLNGTMLLSAACCHAGDTARSHELNVEAKRLAESNPQCEAQLLRLQIEELVVLQDEEDFPKVFALAPKLGEQIDAYAQASEYCDTAIDLGMRYHGTMGQFVSCAALVGCGGCTPEMAKRHFDQAFQHARQLLERARQRGDLAVGDERGEIAALDECTRDANYLLLWHALFDTSGIPRAEAQARRFAERLRLSGGECQAAANDVFRMRYVALGAYVDVLQGNVPDDPELTGTVDPGTIRSPWVRATTLKYLGAVAAAANSDRAMERFGQSEAALLEALKEVASPLFKLILMTVYAEGYRSLRRQDLGVDCHAKAEAMRAKALAMFDDPVSSWWHKEEWRKWLEARGDDGSFPGRAYWY